VIGKMAFKDITGCSKRYMSDIKATRGQKVES